MHRVTPRYSYDYRFDGNVSDGIREEKGVETAVKRLSRMERL